MNDTIETRSSEGSAAYAAITACPMDLVPWFQDDGQCDYVTVDEWERRDLEARTGP